MTSANPNDRLDRIAACYRAVADLLTPERDLHVVNRDDLATAMRFLNEEYRIARDALEARRQ